MSKEKLPTNNYAFFLAGGGGGGWGKRGVLCKRGVSTASRTS